MPLRIGRAEKCCNSLPASTCTPHNTSQNLRIRALGISFAGRTISDMSSKCFEAALGQANPLSCYPDMLLMTIAFWIVVMPSIPLAFSMSDVGLVVKHGQ